MDLEDLKKKKLGDLRYIGKMLGIKSITKMSKQELIEAILSGESKAAAAAYDGSAASENLENNEQTAPVPDKDQQTERNSARSRRGRRGNLSKKAQKSAVDADVHEEASTDNSFDTSSKKSSDGNEPSAQDTADTDKKEIEEKQEETKAQDNTEEVDGLLEILPEGYGFIRVGKYMQGGKDVYVPPTFIRKFNLKTGDQIYGRSKPQRDNDRYHALCYINTVNDDTIETVLKRKPFESLIPIYPDEKIKLETVSNELSTRLIDLIAPIGKGQRGMIVSPPKAGKTVLLKKIANAISENYPDIKLILLLIDERPEEVTDMRESVKGDVISSTFDEMPEKHIKVSEMVFERAKRLVEHGKDVVILMDSLTRLARAYNITISPTGRSLSGGLDPGALYNPKRFFGAARNIRGGGSLTIVATALIDTGSKMDDVIFEEFKGTGNMELHLDRKLSEKRIFPAIDINKSGTRKEELLLSEKELNSVFAIRRAMSNLGTGDVTEMIVSKMTKTRTNDEFIKTINIPQDAAK